jgi:hypothetical protein
MLNRKTGVRREKQILRENEHEPEAGALPV